jgi:geranylgeranyl pyrophosphate synthase
MASSQQPQDADKADGLGERVGLLFQLQDDYLDLLGGKGRERVGSDIAEGKLSYPVVWCLENAVQKYRQPLLDIVGATREDTSDAMIREAMDLLTLTGAMDATAARLRELRNIVNESEAAAVLPGLVALILAPVEHAL